MMLNKYENYLQQQQQNQQHPPQTKQQQQLSCGGVATSMAVVTTAGSTDYGTIAANISKSERESIHSGQFMVSHFEAEEAQEDDLEEDDEVKMIDPEDPNLTKPDDLENTCRDVQLFVPRNVTYLQEYGLVGAGVTSHLEIETSLTKLFKCMNLAYSQKLTSPKWNHFKGIRLRWKDKIRLNNVIWRCWHMQFILKRRTPVCQFASPLDVDIHSNPQSVVLEGKYWKRQTTVIKAEYRKWRKNSKSKTAGCLTYDTKSEFDFLEWSPLNDRTLMLPDDWTNDTLFSSINGPFPFPDPREIARGAGIADFIQPSLGSLQPNIDDIDLTIDELLQPNRLPPVPEEGTDEMLKNVEYNFSAIMGSEQMDANSMVEVVNNTSNSLTVNDDTNMLDLNTPLDALQFQSEVVQRYTSAISRENNSGQLMQTSETNQSQTIASVDAMMTDERPSTLVSDGGGSSTALGTASSSMRMHSKHFPTTSEGVLNNRSTNNEFPSKSVMKGRISKNSQRPFRREPHNYDKAQPTLHQTTIYQQMLAEHQKTQQSQHLQPSMPSTALKHQTMTFHQQLQQQQTQMQPTQIQYPTSASVRSGSGEGGTTYVAYTGAELPSSVVSSLNASHNLLNASLTNSKPKRYGILQAASPCIPNTTQMNANNSSQPSTSSIMLQSVKTEPQTDILSMYNLSAANDVYGVNANLNINNNSNSYKPYPSVGSFKKSSSTGTYINMRVNTNSPYMHEQTTVAQHIHQQSLPLNLGCQLPSLPSPIQLQVPAQCQLSPSSSHQHQSMPHLLTTQQHQMQQQGQQQQATANMSPREMFRSNSLPLNVTLQNLESRSNHDNFAVPKYQVKNNKPRSRSNSIHQHTIVAVSGANKTNGGTAGNLVVSSQLQSATSDPMLSNSTLAQLLTTNSRKPSMLKKQSSSTSAISNVNMPMPAMAMPTVVAPPPSTSAVHVKAGKAQNVSGTSTSVNYFATSNTPGATTTSTGVSNATSTADTTYPRQTMQRQQEQQQKSPKKSASLPMPAATPMLHSPPASKMLSYPLASNQAAMCTNALSLSPDSFHDQDSPLSTTHSLKFPRESQRRVGHIHAEQKRRYNIKNGFDLLHSLIPQLQQNPNVKLSKAAMLQKGADHIRHLRAERNHLKDHMEALLKERDILNNSLTHLHSILPANGAPVTRQGTEHVLQLYDQYVRHRTMQDWKFWILGLILEPLLASYTASVSSASMEELRRTAFLWVDQHCSLIDLRPAVSNKLKYLSMKTDILSDPPSTLQEEVAKAVYNNNGHHPNLHGT